MTTADFARAILLLWLLISSPVFGQRNLLPGEIRQPKNQLQEVQQTQPAQQSEPVFELPQEKTAWEIVEGTPAENTNDVTTAPSIILKETSIETPIVELTEREKQLIQYAKSLDELKKLRRIETMLEEIIPRVTPCVVSIGETASGVIVKPSGIVVTSSHVTRKAGRVLDIRLHDGQMLKGITLGSNAANDTSAIQLLGNGPWPYLKTVAPDYTAQAGQWCVAFGYPLSWPRDKPSSGRIGRVTGQYRGKIVTDCPIMGGDSGGALVDLNGNLLGINSSVRLDVTQNLHVPIKRYRDDWNYMMTRQDVDIVTAKAANIKSESTAQTPAPAGKPYLGIYAESIDGGVRIRDVRRNSPAEKAALLPEDVIWQIDETSIGSFAELLKYLATLNGGDQITVRINRFGVKLDINVTLDQR